MQELKDKKVLVTGGCGFIGSHIVDALVALGANVVVLDNLVSGKKENIAHHGTKVTFIEKDLRDEEALDQVLEGVDCVSHQAALRSVPKSVDRPLEYHDVNVTGTLKLFVKAKEKGIKRIGFASSSSIYGERFDFPEKETDLPCPLSPYAATKLCVEHYAYFCTQLYGMEIVCLRYFNVFGPRQSLENQYAVVVPKFIVSLLKGESPPIYGDGGQERDFTYIDNVVAANLAALTTPGVGGQAFNVASDDPRSVNELLKTLNTILGTQIPGDYKEGRQGDVRKTHACIEKSKDVLGWQPKVNFQEGLEKTAAWFKENHSL